MLFCSAAFSVTWFKGNYQCKLTNIDNINFGTIEASVVNPVTVLGKFEISCSGQPLPKTMGFCLGINDVAIYSGFRNLNYQGKPTGTDADKLSFRFNGVQDTRPIGAMWAMSPPPYSIYGPLQNGKFAIDFTAKLTPDDKGGYRANEGLYISTPTVSLYYGATANGYYPAQSNCIYTDWPHQEPAGTITIKANAKSSGNITVDKSIDFLSDFDLSKIPPQNGTISARCNAGTKYQSGLDVSPNLPNDKNRRAMKRAGGTDLIYL